MGQLRGYLAGRPSGPPLGRSVEIDRPLRSTCQLEHFRFCGVRFVRDGVTLLSQSISRSRKNWRLLFLFVFGRSRGNITNALAASKLDGCQKSSGDGRSPAERPITDLSRKKVKTTLVKLAASFSVVPLSAALRRRSFCYAVPLRPLLLFPRFPRNVLDRVHPLIEISGSRDRDQGLSRDHLISKGRIAMLGFCCLYINAVLWNVKR